MRPAPAGDSEVKPITARTFFSGIVRRRVKPLPLEANVKATQFVLYQLEEKVLFRCVRCRLESIRDSALAADEAGGRLMCQKCFAREVRPRQFKPTRMVPFPSLIAWLNFKKPNVLDASVVDISGPNNLGNRPVEAVLPSGSRLMQPDAITAAPTSVSDLPATAIRTASGGLDEATRLAIADSTNSAARASLGIGPNHPCERVFGGPCAHPMCYFRQAPQNLSLAVLMGLVAEAGPDEVHQPVYDLPPKDPRPPRDGTIEAESAFQSWVARRKASANQAEWQLWNQPGADALVESLCPQASASAGLGGIAGLRNILSTLRGSHGSTAHDANTEDNDDD